MKALKRISVLAVVVFAAACAPGDILGPPMDFVSIEVARVGMPGDVLTVYVNGEAQRDQLTDTHPVHTYWVEIQVKRRSGYKRYESGTVYVHAESRDFGALSKKKSKTAHTDRVTQFDFKKSDFR